MHACAYVATCVYTSPNINYIGRTPLTDPVRGARKFGAAYYSVSLCDAAAARLKGTAPENKVPARSSLTAPPTLLSSRSKARRSRARACVCVCVCASVKKTARENKRDRVRGG